MEKLYTSKTFLKMAGGRMHTPHPTPDHKFLHKSSKESGNFSHLAPLVLFFFTKKQSEEGGYGTMAPPEYGPAVITTTRYGIGSINYQIKFVFTATYRAVNKLKYQHLDEYKLQYL